MKRDIDQRRRDRVVIAITFYLFISVTAGFFTFMRGFEFTGCSGSCDLAVMGNARMLFLYADIGLLALVPLALVILRLLRRPVLWLAVSALVTISVLAVVTNIALTVAKTTGAS